MTAAIITFPTMLERDDCEFRRKGTSSYIRVIDEAEALWVAVNEPGKDSVLSGRIDAFARQVGRLVIQRPELAGDTLVLGRHLIELRNLPTWIGSKAM